jgi:hypothetical protein
MEAMIGGFFDSLTYMKQQAEAHHGHEHKDWCCGWNDNCDNKKDDECCGKHHH